MNRVNWKLILKVSIAFSLLMVADASTVVAQPKVGSKHLIILRPGLDAVWGSYIFAVRNDQTEPLPLTTRVMLPEETSDWRPQEGVNPDDLSLGDDGLVLTKTFPPGLQIVSLSFKLDSLFGKTNMTIKPPVAIDDFTLLVAKNSGLNIEEGPVQPAPESPDPGYDAWRSMKNFEINQDVVFKVAGVPEGRRKLWIIGGIIGTVMLISGLTIAWRRRPKQTMEDHGLVLSA